MAWTVKRLAISAFVIAHVAAVGLWNLPSCAIKARLIEPVAYYLMPLGLWQEWGIFAPEPAKTTAALEALVVDARGLLHEYAFPVTAGMSPRQAAGYYRDAKLAAIVASDDLLVLREIVARHAVRNLRIPAADFPITVQLQYQVRVTPPLGAPAAAPPAPPVPMVLMTYRYPSLADVQP